MDTDANRFVSQEEIDAGKVKRQEEWEKVRRPEDPAEAPEEPVENRTLYDRLKEQRDMKQQEYDEETKLASMVRGLDDDESEFLDYVNNVKAKHDSALRQEEEGILAEMKEKIHTELVDDEPLHAQATTSGSLLKRRSTDGGASNTQGAAPKRSKQAAMLSGMIKRKRTDDNSTADNSSLSTSAKTQTVSPPPTALTVTATRPTALLSLANYSGASSSDTSDDDGADSDDSRGEVRESEEVSTARLFATVTTSSKAKK